MGSSATTTSTEISTVRRVGVGRESVDSADLGAYCCGFPPFAPNDMARRMGFIFVVASYGPNRLKRVGESASQRAGEELHEFRDDLIRRFFH
jgi:hypothetical protein